MPCPCPCLTLLVSLTARACSCFGRARRDPPPSLLVCLPQAIDVHHEPGIRAGGPGRTAGNNRRRQPGRGQGMPPARDHAATEGFGLPRRRRRSVAKPGTTAVPAPANSTGRQPGARPRPPGPPSARPCFARRTPVGKHAVAADIARFVLFLLLVLLVLPVLPVLGGGSGGSSGHGDDAAGSSAVGVLRGGAVLFRAGGGPVPEAGVAGRALPGPPRLRARRLRAVPGGPPRRRPPWLVRRRGRRRGARRRWYRQRHRRRHRRRRRRAGEETNFFFGSSSLSLGLILSSARWVPGRRSAEKKHSSRPLAAIFSIAIFGLAEVATGVGRERFF